VRRNLMVEALSLISSIFCRSTSLVHFFTMKTVKAAALSSALGLLAATHATTNNRPIIGIYSAPLEQHAPGCDGGCDYVAASYVKWLESAGAESLPIRYNSSDDEVEAIFAQINGLLLPGGGAGLPSGAKHAVELAIEANDNGTYFPVWGTCLGFEWLLEIVAGGNVLDTGFDSENISLPLNLTATAATSRLLGTISSVPGHRDRSDASATALRADLSNNDNPPAMNNHQAGITPHDFVSHEKLDSFFNVLSTNKDRKDKEFVSMIEAQKYPIYGSQWHPEKNNFEWGMSHDGTPYEAINHSPEAVYCSQSLVNFFVGEARRNTHSREVSDPSAKLFWDYAISQVKSPEFQQSYIIP